MPRYSLIFAAFFLSGCAAKKLAVGQVDTLIEYQMERRLPLYSKQKDQLSVDIDRFLNEQKPFVRETIPFFQHLTPELTQVDLQYSKLRSIYQKVALSFAQLMSKYIALLDDKQFNDFSHSLKEENQKLSQSKSEGKMDKIYERFEFVFGSLTDQQEKILLAHESYFQERHKLRVSRRELLQQRFFEAHKKNLKIEEREKNFFAAFEEYQTKHSEDLKNVEIIKELIPTLSSKQREFFKGRIEDLQEILQYYLEAKY